MTYVLRAWRWLSLLRPLGHARFRTGVPHHGDRLHGDVPLARRASARCCGRTCWRARKACTPAATFATIVVERLLDLATVLLLFAVALPFAGVDVGAPGPRVERRGFAVAAVAGLAILFVLAGHPERLGRVAARLTRAAARPGSLARPSISCGRLPRA